MSNTSAGHTNYNATVYKSRSATIYLKGTTQYTDIQGYEDSPYPNNNSYKYEGTVYWFVKKP